MTDLQMRSDITDFIVQGRGEFPFDMLRKDECYPADGVTVSMLASAAHDRHLRSMKFRTARSINIHAERWESFGWRVVSIDSERLGKSGPREAA